MDKTCIICSSVFNVKPSHYSKRTTCSQVCGGKLKSLNSTGSNNPNYKMSGIKTCMKCGCEYKSYDNRRKYCSQNCFGLSVDNIEKLKSIATIKRKYYKRLSTKCAIKYTSCEKCKEVFTLPKKRHRKFCFKCYSKVDTICTCIVCQQQFKSYSEKVTCSKKCLSKHKSDSQKGEKSHLWEGGKTSEAMIIRNSLQYSEWRKSVFERDKYTCQDCGTVGGNLNADHIKPFCNFPELRFDINNGKTLCKKCHLKTPTWGYKAAYQKFS